MASPTPSLNPDGVPQICATPSGLCYKWKPRSQGGAVATTAYPGLRCETPAGFVRSPADTITLLSTLHHAGRAAMPQSLVQIYVHFVFSTKGRAPYLQDSAFRDRVHA